MNFETEYKNIKFRFEVEKENYADVSFFMADKFNRLSNQTIVEVKKGNLWPFNIIITSNRLDDEKEVHTHYLSTVLLSTKDDETLLDDLADYLEQENVLDAIAALLDQYEITPGPAWKI